MILKKFSQKIFSVGPVILLYYLSISEVDTEFSNIFEILSFNLQLIIIYYWVLKTDSILANSHIFFAGIINDVIMGLPLGISALTYLIVSFIASYVKNVTVNTSLMSDLFTFFIAVFFSNLLFITLIYNFTELTLTYIDIFYNSFFTILFYPVFWFIFNYYRSIINVHQYD